MAVYLQAEDDVGLPEEVLEQPNFEAAVRWYFIDMRLNFLWSLNLAALILLNFFEVSTSTPTKLQYVLYLASEVRGFECVCKACYDIMRVSFLAW